MRSIMTLAGIRAYAPHVLDDFQFPDRFTIEQPYFLDLLCMETADLEMLYTEPVTLQYAIKLWSMSRKLVWDRIMDAMLEDYSPIENYNRTEDWTDKNVRTDELQTSVENYDEFHDNYEDHPDKTITESTIGYNSQTWTGQHQTEENYNTSSATDHEGELHSTVDNTGTQTHELTRSGNVHGNIGVTTNQQMLTAEVELRLNYQLAYIIIEDFKKKFCLLVY